MHVALRAVFLPMMITGAYGALSYLLGRPPLVLAGIIFAALVVAAVLAAWLAHLSARRGIPALVPCLVGPVAVFALGVFLSAVSEEAYIHWIRGPVVLESGEVGFDRYLYPGNSGMGYADGFDSLGRNLSRAVPLGVRIGLLSALGVAALARLKRPGR